MINFKRTYFFASLFILATPAQVNAEYVWLKPVGCATVITFEKVNEEPQFYYGSKEMTQAAYENELT